MAALIADKKILIDGRYGVEIPIDECIQEFLSGYIQDNARDAQCDSVVRILEETYLRTPKANIAWSLGLFHKAKHPPNHTEAAKWLLKSIYDFDGVIDILDVTTEFQRMDMLENWVEVMEYGAKKGIPRCAYIAGCLFERGHINWSQVWGEYVERHEEDGYSTSWGVPRDIERAKRLYILGSASHSEKDRYVVDMCNERLRAIEAKKPLKSIFSRFFN